MIDNLPYSYILKPLSEEDGGGYLIEFPDLPGCISDGETEEEAILMGKDAIEAWVSTAKASGLNIPTPQKSKTLASKNN